MRPTHRCALRHKPTELRRAWRQRSLHPHRQRTLKLLHQLQAAVVLPFSLLLKAVKMLQDQSLTVSNLNTVRFWEAITPIFARLRSTASLFTGCGLVACRGKRPLASVSGLKQAAVIVSWLETKLSHEQLVSFIRDILSLQELFTPE
jgi:hypothetical protein